MTKHHHMTKLKTLCYTIILLLCCGCQEEFEYTYKNIFNVDLDPDSEYIAVIGDIQEYTMDGNLAHDYLMPTSNWLRSMYKKGYKIDCILQTGDISNNNKDWQYRYFWDTTKDLANEVLYITAIGNHDYEWSSLSQIDDRQSSRLSTYCGFPLTRQHVEAYFEADRMDNVVVRTSIRNEQYDILVLEFGPRPEVIAWAKKYVESNKDRKFILLTHEFLVSPPPGHRVSNGWSDAERQFKTIPATTPQYIWDEIVYPNDNVRCVLCGHNSFSLQFYEKNATGRLVPQILFNLQYVKNGGNGLVQIWRIPKQDGEIDVKVYNTVTNEVYRDSIDDQFNWHNTEFHFAL